VYLVGYIIGMKQYEVIAYETEPGKAPFQDWYDAIKDSRAKTLILARIGRAAGGNFGDWKPITGAKGLCEMRIPYGQWFRVYYTAVEQKVVLLLAGSTKQDQDRTIAKAKAYLAELNRKMKQ
jgi:putative addiction module killer protein